MATTAGVENIITQSAHPTEGAENTISHTGHPAEGVIIIAGFPTGSQTRARTTASDQVIPLIQTTTGKTPDSEPISGSGPILDKKARTQLIGVSVGVSLLIAAMIGLGGFIFWKRQRRSQTRPSNYKPATPNPAEDNPNPRVPWSLPTKSTPRLSSQTVIPSTETPPPGPAYISKIRRNLGRTEPLFPEQLHSGKDYPYEDCDICGFFEERSSDGQPSLCGYRSERPVTPDSRSWTMLKFPNDMEERLSLRVSGGSSNSIKFERFKPAGLMVPASSSNSIEVDSFKYASSSNSIEASPTSSSIYLSDTMVSSIKSVPSSDYANITGGCPDQRFTMDALKDIRAPQPTVPGLGGGWDRNSLVEYAINRNPEFSQQQNSAFGSQMARRRAMSEASTIVECVRVSEWAYEPFEFGVAVASPWNCRGGRMSNERARLVELTRRRSSD